MRQPYNYHNNFESPRMAIHKKDDDQNSVKGISNSVKGTRKDCSNNGNVMNAGKLPPKPQQGNSNVSYRLPPKPVYGQKNNPNRSNDYETSRSR